MLSLSFAACGFHAPILPSSSVKSPTMNVDWKSVNQWDEAQAAIANLDAPWTSSEISDQAGLKKLALELNPIVGYWDPCGIGSTANKELIAWYRHAEIKHGRVAMAGFVGFIVQSLGVHFPWDLQHALPGSLNDVKTISFGDISAVGGPGDQWDALPTAAKVQILLFVGFLEMWGEASVVLKKDGQQHYVRGGKPGYFPTFKNKLPHPVPLDLFDPFGVTKKLSPERKEKALRAEINNGRLAMIGLFGLISASKGLIVPGLDSLPIAKYGGEYMAPFAQSDAGLPFVSEMLNNALI